MLRYYTRACNFYYGQQSKILVKNKKSLPLHNIKEISFDQIEIITRNSKKKIFINQVKKLPVKLQKKINFDLKKITSNKKSFCNLKFNSIPNILGILNLTPDSFSDGGKFNTHNKASKQISNMINSGADIIDVGGESTRPGSETIDPKTEWKRIEKILKNFKKKYEKICLSIDTRKFDIMIKSIRYGADLINDVSGFNYDPYSLLKLNNYDTSKVLHHMQGTPTTMQINPKYENVLLDIYDFFERKIKNISNNKKIILDPGIGFGKNLKHNLTLISKISLFHSLGFPILIGTSRKRFINQISGNYDSVDRTGGTLASVLFLLSQGVQIFRIHNVKEIKQGILVFEKINEK